MGAPIVYRWDDANAPVARGERRSLSDILYACLVTGYGSKPGAGWTREYVNATFDKSVFRPGSGTRFYLLVDGVESANPYYSVVRGFEVMTDVNTGLFPFYASPTIDACMTSINAGTTARPWMVIADERAFYFVCWANITAAPTNGSLNKSELFFGDIVKFIPSDAYGCLLMTSGNTNTGMYITAHSYSTATGAAKYMPRKLSGVAAPSTPAIYRGGGPGPDHNMPESTGMTYVTGDQILITRPTLGDGAAYTLRGWIPGLYYLCHPYTAFNNLATITADGKSYLHIIGYLSGGYLGGYLIALNDWWV